MHQIPNQTREQKIAIYMDCSKEELASMLIDAQGLLQLSQKQIIPLPRIKCLCNKGKRNSAMLYCDGICEL